MFKIIKTDNEEGDFFWTVQRIDGKSFDDGIVGINFEYNEQGALAAIECSKRLHNKYEAEKG
jgi:hypothetical protein